MEKAEKEEGRERRKSAHPDLFCSIIVFLLNSIPLLHLHTTQHLPYLERERERICVCVRVCIGKSVLAYLNEF